MSYSNDTKPSGSYTDDRNANIIQWNDSVETWDDRVIVSAVSSFSTLPTTATRNDSTNAVGFNFQVNQSTSLSKIGRLYIAGNTNDHVVKLWNAANQTTPIVSVTILASSASDSNGFKWAYINAVTLSPGISYAIASDETVGQDTWKDLWSPTLNSNLTNISSAWTGSLGSFPGNGGNVSLIYDTINLNLVSSYSSFGGSWDNSSPYSSDGRPQIWASMTSPWTAYTLPWYTYGGHTNDTEPI